MRFQAKSYPYQSPKGLRSPEALIPVLIVGAGPVGLAAAIELANHSIPTVIIDDNNRVSLGSRAICWSKRSLEIFDRLGIGDRAVDKGVIWNIGRTYHRDQELFNFDLLPEDGHKRPAFINLQQYYVEQFLIDQAICNELIDLRFHNRFIGVSSKEDHVEIEIETPEGRYYLQAEYLLACDGANSAVRTNLGLEFVGELFEERFLIADIEMEREFPSERRFWFEPLFHAGQSALLHKQPDNIYRIDLQLGWGVDPTDEQKLERVIPRIERVVGTCDFRVDWVSVYSFQCCRLERFVHGRIIFAGDSAHVVSPFGARGGNSGIQDIDNLGWKLAAIIKKNALPDLLESYNSERTYGADENIAHSTRTTRFMTPINDIEKSLRDQLLKLAIHCRFARTWINSGRLSVPCVYPIDDPCMGALPVNTCPGSVASDVPQGTGWLLDRLGQNMIILCIGKHIEPIEGTKQIMVEINKYVQYRYLGEAESAVYLVRPDQVIAGRWINPDRHTIKMAVNDIWTSGCE